MGRACLAHFLESVDLSQANLRGANLKNAILRYAMLQSSLCDATTVYNQWTVLPNGFEPEMAGLTFVPSPIGDFNVDDVLSEEDVNLLSARIRQGYVRPLWMSSVTFDVNADRQIDRDDHRFWVKGLAHTWFGDTNLNGEFNSSDMVQVFVSGKYEIGQPASWSEGDWNGDGIFDSNDMVTAFVDGGYEKGLRTDVAAVPEPGASMLLVIGAVMGLFGRRIAAEFTCDVHVIG